MNLYYTEGPQWNYIYFLEYCQLINFVTKLVTLKIIIKTNVLKKEIRSEYKNQPISLEYVTSTCPWAYIYPVFPLDLSEK